MNNTEKVLEKLSGTIEDRGELPSVSDYETLRKAINRYGDNGQIDVAIEEMSELTKALLKQRRELHILYSESKSDVEVLMRFDELRNNVCEEMADVIIMLVQLQMIYDNKKEVSKYINSKVERLKTRMRGSKYDA